MKVNASWWTRTCSDTNLMEYKIFSFFFLFFSKPLGEPLDINKMTNLIQLNQKLKGLIKSQENVQIFIGIKAKRK